MPRMRVRMRVRMRMRMLVLVRVPVRMRIPQQVRLTRLANKGPNPMPEWPKPKPLFVASEFVNGASFNTIAHAAYA